MDAFEGIHSVQISSSPPPATSSSPAYEVLKAGRRGIAVYSSAVFFGTPSSQGTRSKTLSSRRREAEDEGCVVGKLVDLDPEPELRMEGRGKGRPTSGLNCGVHSRLRSSSLEIRGKEIQEKGSEILSEQLDAAKRELKLKDKECQRLSQVRNQLEQELEELTASLFEEAHKMVREANVKQAASEKQLKEAQGKIDVLQAEVTALKSLVLTSTPSSPNRQLHPQLQLPVTRVAHKMVGGHIRNKSVSGSFPSPPGKPESPSLAVQPMVKEDSEMDSVLYAEFLLWKEHPSLDRSSALMSRIYREEITPCLSFTRSELSQLVQSAVENNSLTIEPVAMSALPMVKASVIECGGPNGCRAAVETKCALSGVSRLCRHRIKLGDKGSYYYISPSSRARITAVCNFFTYIRYIQQGLVRHDAEQMFWEVMRLRREMTVAKLGFYLTEQG
ncbi:guanine nucleotide exchange factor for Rab-3A isoform X5 [Dunckerocampus dactyliophorus]|uniref:guanine nucleotide exchange factor for Rab-3A isoform X5 n=1 Tax=Dunckerocampus dactyliophorus TaxID=161453 RepID=UPI0024051849|nr:guanine nucleotide exchange factor for Rab-3A isoform X5 [Dunckerocampus dactyliophorus]